jgi:hypothetical protein
MSDPGGAHLVLTRSGPAVPWLGQMVRIDVALWRPHANEAALPPFSFDELEVPGAIAVFRAEAPPPSELEEVGVRYLVQHRTLLVFAQEDGEIVLPPLTARFDAVEGQAPVRVKSEPLRFNAALPHGLPGEASLVVAPGLTLTSTLDRPLAGLAVGGGFTRTVVLAAQDTDPIMLPELDFAPVEGLRVYAAEPHVEASAERGAIRASRTFSATYVVERVGHYELPALKVAWLDPVHGRYAVAQTGPLVFWARPSWSLGLSAFGSVPGLGLSLALGASLLLAALVYATRRRLREGPFAWEQRLAARWRERRAFLAFERALGHAAPLALLSRAYAWLALRLPNAPRTLAPLRAASQPSAETLRHWEEQAFAGNAKAVAARGVHRIFARARRALASSSAEAVVSDINRHAEPKEDSSWTTPP